MALGNGRARRGLFREVQPGGPQRFARSGVRVRPRCRVRHALKIETLKFENPVLMAWPFTFAFQLSRSCRERGAASRALRGEIDDLADDRRIGLELKSRIGWSNRCFCHLLFYGLVGIDFPVADVDDAVGVLGDIVFVGHENDGVPLSVEACEQGHDFVTGA